MVSSLHPFGVKSSLLSLPLPTFWFFLPNSWYDPGWVPLPWETYRGDTASSAPVLSVKLFFCLVSPSPLAHQKKVLSQVSTSNKISFCQQPSPVPAYFSLEDLMGKTGQTRQDPTFTDTWFPMLHPFPSLMLPLIAFLLSPWVGQTNALSLII